MTDKKTYKLSEATIAHIAQLVQLAILTGTQITDNFRLVRLAEGDVEGVLVPDEEYMKNSEAGIQRLVEKAQELQSQTEQ